MKRAAFYIAASIAAFILAGARPALAQEEEGPEGGISAYAVARVKVLDGSVWVRPSDGGEWEEFSSNSPIPPYSRVSVPDGSEAELQFHGGQFVLLTSGTDLEVRDLEEGNSVFRLRAGEIRFDLPPDDFAPVSVRVPGGALAQFPEPGRQWLTVTDSDETRLVVRRGRAVVIVDGDEHGLDAGEEAVIGRDVTIGQYSGGADDFAGSPPPSEDAGSRGAAPPVVESELREYGEWVDVPTYGTVWRPRVAVGWSPYVYGRWVWISPYGWTWVSNEPWGWYPYRCGYWLTDPVFGWVWSPYNAFVSVNFVFGSNRYRHHNVFYRPATVRFIPEGRNVRWVPLRPGERFRPAGFTRGDARLTRWNRPLESGRVFVRGGPDRREWRDWSAVRTERQAEVRKNRAVQQRPDTRTLRPERRAVRPPATVERKKSSEPPGRGQQIRKPVPRSAPREDRGSGTTRGAVQGPRMVERQAPPRSVSVRPMERERMRDSGPAPRPAVREGRGSGTTRGAVQGPRMVERQAPPRSVPAARPPALGNVREIGPGSDRAVATPVRPEGARGIVRERATPPGRSPDTRSRVQETRDNRGGGDGGRGGSRGGDRGGGGGRYR